MRSTRTIIIGLDGATFDVLDPLIEKGKLKVFKTLKENGAYGTLESTLPPVTAPAWMSLATGKNPGKTGVFDFRNIEDPKSFKLRPVSSIEFRNNGAFWDFLSRKGKRVGIFNYPMLYPPYLINGFMVGGVGCPEDQNIAYPSELMEELKEIVGEYKILVPFNRSYYTNRPDLFLKDLNQLLEKQIKIINYLLDKKKLDIFIFVLSITDFLQHYMWNYWEEYKAGKNTRYGEEFVEVWKRVDEFMGTLVARDPSTHFFIVSDHGFGSLRGCFAINKWLEKEGYLIRKKGLFFNSFLNFLKSSFFRLIPLPEISNIKLLKKLYRETKKNLIETIDLSKSLAFALEHSAVGQIYINWTKRNPVAPIKDKKTFEKIRGEIIGKLKRFVEKHPQLDSIEIYCSEDVYSGNKLDYMPDIVFSVNGFAFDVPPDIFDCIVAPNKNPNKNGTHKKEGIFIAYGPLIRSGARISDARIIDIAPTLLYLLCQDIPQDVDGKVLKEIFNS